MRKKKKLKLSILLSLIFLILLCISLGALFFGYQKLKALRQESSFLKEQIQKASVTAYVANREIRAGESLYFMADENKGITTDMVNLTKKELLNTLPQSFFLTESAQGMAAVMDLPMDTPLLCSMAAKTKISTDLRELEISCAHLMTTQAEMDTVDLRILFPDGSDYLVLSKKPVKNLKLDTCIFDSYLDEGEILRYSSAVIDAFMTSGTYLYTTRYVESSLQEEATPNYPVRSACLDILQNDPNILEVAKETLNQQARMDLNTRLSVLTKEQLSAVSEGFGLTDTARGSVLQGRLELENEQALQNEEEIVAEDRDALEEKKALSDFGIGETISKEEVTKGGIEEENP